LTKVSDTVWCQTTKKKKPKYVEDALAEEIITSKISSGDEIFMDIEEGAQELTVKIQKNRRSNKMNKTEWS
jgi:ATP-dependent Clp protease ATP-binding subunit ClpC